MSPSETLILSITVFCLTMVSAVGVYVAAETVPWRSRRHVGRKLLLDIPDSLARDPAETHYLATSALSQAVESFFRAVLRQPTVQRMRSRLSGDGLGNADEQVISRAIQILMVLAGIVVAVPVARALGVSVFLAGLCGGTIAYLVPDYFVQRRRLQKRMKITRELPAMLDLLVVTLEAGLGLSEAIRLVGRQSERQGSVLGKELSTVAAELGAGVILANAMKALGERTGVDEIKSLSAVFDSE